MDTPKWRRATIKFLKEQHYALVDYGNSSRGCQTIEVGEVRDVYFEGWDEGVPGLKKEFRLAHVELNDVVPLKDDEFEIISLGEPEEMHPLEKMLKEIRERSEKSVQNIQNTEKL